MNLKRHARFQLASTLPRILRETWNSKELEQVRIHAEYHLNQELSIWFLRALKERRGRVQVRNLLLVPMAKLAEAVLGSRLSEHIAAAAASLVAPWQFIQFQYGCALAGEAPSSVGAPPVPVAFYYYDRSANIGKEFEIVIVAPRSSRITERSIYAAFECSYYRAAKN